MRTTARSCVLGLVLLFASAQPARADIWDWLEQMSGPGPFTTRPFTWRLPGNVTFMPYCHQKPDDGNGVLRALDTPQQPGDPRTCVFLDFRRFEVPETTRFFATNVTIWEAGTSYRIAGPIDVGWGIGHFHISGGGLSGDKLTLTFPRLVFMPALMFDRARDSGWATLFQVYFRETRLLGTLDQKNIAVKPGQEAFSIENDGVASLGFIIDVTPIVDAVLKPMWPRRP